MNPANPSLTFDAESVLILKLQTDLIRANEICNRQGPRLVELENLVQRKNNQITKANARILDFEGRTFSENNEIIKLKEENEKLYAANSELSRVDRRNFGELIIENVRLREALANADLILKESK